MRKIAESRLDRNKGRKTGYENKILAPTPIGRGKTNRGPLDKKKFGGFWRLTGGKRLARLGLQQAGLKKVGELGGLLWVVKKTSVPKRGGLEKKNFPPKRGAWDKKKNKNLKIWEFRVLKRKGCADKKQTKKPMFDPG